MAVQRARSLVGDRSSVDDVGSAGQGSGGSVLVQPIYAWPVAVGGVSVAQVVEDSDCVEIGGRLGVKGVEGVLGGHM